jgi:hypothetical protein
MEGSIAWRPLKSSNVWWPLKGFNAWWPMEGKGEAHFHIFTFSPFPTFPQQISFKPSFFPLILRFYFTMVLGCYLHISFFFLDL